MFHLKVTNEISKYTLIDSDNKVIYGEFYCITTKIFETCHLYFEITLKAQSVNYYKLVPSSSVKYTHEISLK